MLANKLRKMDIRLQWATLIVAILTLLTAIVSIVLPLLAPKPYIALILDTNNQHPLNDTLWIVNPENLTADTFTFYINSPNKLTATTWKPSIDVNFSKGNSGTQVYVVAHNIRGGDAQAINLTLSAPAQPSFQIISTDAHYCNTTLEINYPKTPLVINNPQPYQVWINSTFGCSSQIVHNFETFELNLTATR